MKRTWKLTGVLLLALGAVLAGAQQAAKLKVGDTAPSLSVARWLKGAPVAKFSPGKVYVVEFLATWHEPSRQSIPYLTKIAKKFKGKATFAGISVLEQQRPNSNATVARFVRRMGPKLDFTVGMDGPAGSVAKTWIGTTKQEDIPTAFVIGRDGRIAWIGRPTGALDGVIAQVVANKFDLGQTSQKQAKEQARDKELKQLLTPVMQAIRSGQSKIAVERIDQVLSSHPDLEIDLATARFQSLLQYDEPAAYAYAKKEADGVLKSEAGGLNDMAWAIVQDDADLGAPDYALALSLAQRAADLTKNQNPYILDTLAYSEFKNHHTGDAIASEEKAIEIASKPKSEVRPEILAEFRDRLATMQREVS